MVEGDDPGQRLAVRQCGGDGHFVAGEDADFEALECHGFISSTTFGLLCSSQKGGEEMAEEHSLWRALLKGAAGALGALLIAWLTGWLDALWGQLMRMNMSLSKHLLAQSPWPNWWAYASSLWPAFTFLRWALYRWRNRKDSINRFKKLTSGGIVWRWSGMVQLPYGLRPYCSACDTELVYDERGNGVTTEWRVRLSCEHCHRTATDESGDFVGLKQRIKRQIDRLVRTGQWRQFVDQ